jgi:hypothetical protein
MATWRNSKAGSRDSQINLPADPHGTMAGCLRGGTVLGKRYRVMEAIDSESFTAEDLALCQTVIVDRRYDRAARCQKLASKGPTSLVNSVR